MKEYAYDTEHLRVGHGSDNRIHLSVYMHIRHMPFAARCRTSTTSYNVVQSVNGRLVLLLLSYIRLTAAAASMRK